MPRHSRPSPLRTAILDAIGAHRRWDKGTIPRNRTIPLVLTQGLAEGLLTYFNQPARRRDLDLLHLDTLGIWLAIYLGVHGPGAPPRRRYMGEVAMDRARRQIAHGLPALVKALTQHPSGLVLSHEHQILAAALTQAPPSRDKWIRASLPKILDTLLHCSRCPHLTCPRRTTLPDRNELDKWPKKGKALQFHILAHFHGSTYSTVRARTQAPSPI